MRDSTDAPPSLTMRRAKAWAASTYTGSLSVTRACSGVLVRGRAMVKTLRLGASKVSIDGYGVVRRHSVYKARRYLSSPGLASQSVPPPNAAVKPSLGRGGRTEGPYIFGLSNPLAKSAW